MKTQTIWCHGLSLLFCVALLFTSCVSSANAQSIQWQTELDQARKIALEENKLVLLHFYTDWCRPCKDLERFVFNSTRVAKVFQTNVVPVKLNADDAEKLVKTHGVTSVPFDVVMTPKGRVVLRRKSPRDTESYVRMVDRLSRVLELMASGKEPALIQNLDELEKLIEVEKAAFQSERDKLMPEKPHLMQVRPSSFSSNLKRKHDQREEFKNQEQGDIKKEPAKIVANPFFGNAKTIGLPKADKVTPPIGVVNSPVSELQNRPAQIKSNKFFRSTSSNLAPASPIETPIQKDQSNVAKSNKQKIVVNPAFNRDHQFVPPQPPNFNTFRDPYRINKKVAVSKKTAPNNATIPKPAVVDRNRSSNDFQPDNAFQPAKTTKRVPAQFASQRKIVGETGEEDNSFPAEVMQSPESNQLLTTQNDIPNKPNEVIDEEANSSLEVVGLEHDRAEFNFSQDVLMGTSERTAPQVEVESMVWSAGDEKKSPTSSKSFSPVAEAAERSTSNESNLVKSEPKHIPGAADAMVANTKLAPTQAAETLPHAAIVAEGKLSRPKNTVPDHVENGRFNPVNSVSGELVSNHASMKRENRQIGNTNGAIQTQANTKSKFVQAGFKRVKKEPEPVAKAAPPKPAVLGYVRVHSSEANSTVSGSAGETSLHTPELNSDSKSKYALKGMCPITLLTKGEWIEGNPKIGCVHREQVYLFVNKADRDLFLSDPDRYSPILAGFDPVVYLETGALERGNEANGVFMGKKPNQRVVLFGSIETREKFKTAPAKYLQHVRDAMDRN